MQALPAVVTEFERQVRKLGLSNETLESSAELRHWCDDDKIDLMFRNGC
jgi:hypothetical protein